MVTIYEKASDLFIHKQYKQTIEKCLEGIELDKKNISLLYLLAKSYYNTNDSNNCEIVLKKILDFKPSENEANYLLGILYTQKKRYSEAINVLKHIYDSYSRKWKFHMYLTEAYLGIKKFEDAIIEANTSYNQKRSVFNLFNIIRVYVFRYKILSLILFSFSAFLAYFSPIQYSLIFFIVFMAYPIISAIAFISEKRIINGALVVLYLLIFSYLYYFIHYIA